LKGLVNEFNEMATLERFVLYEAFSWSVIKAIPSVGKFPPITGIARFGHSQAGDLSFCDREPEMESCEIQVGSQVLCPECLADALSWRFPGVLCIPVADPRSLFIDIGRQLLEQESVAVSSAIPRPFGIDPTVRIGSQTVIHPETRIDEGAVIGAQCVIHRGTWVQSGAIIRDNTALGVEGINAYRGLDGKLRNFPHFAGAIIGANVEIGAGSVIVRGILTSTQIGNHSIVGNLCNIGHGVELAENVWISVGGLIGGHTRIGAGATLGMGVAVKDNIEIGAGAQIGMGSVVVKSVKAQSSVFGNPASVVRPIKAGPDR
jgi:UDP-3-O-[3-hydroxymyristoyl] glucosamine N-acyltransferase